MINLIPTALYKENVKEIQGIKKYTGERFAFHYWFFICYQSMLIVPCIVGLVFFGLQSKNYLDLGNFEKGINMKENGIFGIFITIWASVFLQAWKNKMRYLSQ